MKKLVSALLAVMLVATMLMGCGSEESNTVKFGTNAEFPPFEFVTTAGVIGEYDGIDMAIAKEIGAQNGMEAVISKTKVSRRTKQLLGKK